MTKLWCRVLLLFLFTYGPFLLFQAFVDPWPTKQMHNITLFLGGVTLLLWGIRYFIKKPKVIIYGINVFVITMIATFGIIIIPILVVMALRG